MEKLQKWYDLRSTIHIYYLIEVILLSDLLALINFCLSQTTKCIQIRLASATSTSQATAVENLKAAMTSSANPGIIVWGGTNLVVDDYRDALELAYKYERPVRFVRW